MYLHTNIFTIENFVILFKEKSMYCLQLLFYQILNICKLKEKIFELLDLLSA